MRNILFVLYNDFHSNSASHVHHFANCLVAEGLDCVVTVPANKETVANLGNNHYKVTEFKDYPKLNKLFSNQQPPDIVHIWTPREIVRKYCQKLKEIYSFKLFIHLEDNEEYLLAKLLQKPNTEISRNPNSPVPEHLSHPIKYRQFLAIADGVTVIMDKLQKFVPSKIPTLILWPGVDQSFFYPRKADPLLANSLGIPINSNILCYTGNVHSANAQEVRSLYLAVAMMNREGKPSVLIRTGKDFCNFLGDDDSWARRYSIELGYVDGCKLPSILSLADVLIQPGRADSFNNYRFPSKLPEFLAMGKPVILPMTNIGRFMENMKDAMVLPVVDALNILNAIDLLSSNKDLYEQLSIGSYNFAQHHLNWHTNSLKLIQFYESSFLKNRSNLAS